MDELDLNEEYGRTLDRIFCIDAIHALNSNLSKEYLFTLTTPVLNDLEESLLNTLHSS